MTLVSPRLGAMKPTFDGKRTCLAVDTAVRLLSATWSFLVRQLRNPRSNWWLRMTGPVAKKNGERLFMKADCRHREPFTKRQLRPTAHSHPTAPTSSPRISMAIIFGLPLWGTTERKFGKPISVRSTQNLATRPRPLSTSRWSLWLPTTKAAATWSDSTFGAATSDGVDLAGASVVIPAPRWSRWQWNRSSRHHGLGQNG